MALPLIIFEVPVIRKKFEFNKLALIVGSLLPDVVDKTLLFLNYSSGRGISHTLLFIILSFIILHFSVKRRTHISLSFFTGMVSHLILDLPEVPLLYPFILYDYAIVEDPIGLWLYRLFNNPVILLTEILGISFLVYILIKNNLYNTKSIRLYLSGKSQYSSQYNSKIISNE